MIAVLVKELRTRMRGWRAPAVLTVYLAALGIVCYLVLRNNLSGGSFSQQQATKVGSTLFNTLAWLQLLLIVFITPATTAAAISGERQRQTLDLLLVTRLSSLGITVGKLLAAIAFDLLLILCSLPIFALVFLFGGVEPGQVARVFLLFLMLIFSFGSIGILVSVLTRRANSATVVSYVIVLILTLGLALAAGGNYIFGTGDGTLPVLGYFDPVFALMAVLPNTGYNFDSQIWQVNILAALITSVICVALCATLLRENRA
ncbi:MAG TPA: ABC transporter permease [Chloroflexota bacterium]|jgi:ABC-type transport system involved in multi-copper enzyme maturation permease subunit|nr:ABC transporter permease [Chloroflexota bacterium]